MPIIFFFSLLFLIVLLRVSPSTGSLLHALRSSSGVPVRHQDRGKAPQHAQSFLSISLISLLCLYWHLPTCLFIPPCESSFLFTTAETNYCDKMNIEKEGKTLPRVLLSQKPCSVIKY